MMNAPSQAPPNFQHGRMNHRFAISPLPQRLCHDCENQSSARMVWEFSLYPQGDAQRMKFPCLTSPMVLRIRPKKEGVPFRRIPNHHGCWDLSSDLEDLSTTVWLVPHYLIAIAMLILLATFGFSTCILLVLAWIAGFIFTAGSPSVLPPVILEEGTGPVRLISRCCELSWNHKCYFFAPSSAVLNVLRNTTSSVCGIGPFRVLDLLFPHLALFSMMSHVLIYRRIGKFLIFAIIESVLAAAEMDHPLHLHSGTDRTQFFCSSLGQ